MYNRGIAAAKRYGGNDTSLKKESKDMPKDSHQRAAEFHELAAHAHRSAAVHHGKEDHQTGHEHSRQALEHSARAYEFSQEAHRNRKLPPARKNKRIEAAARISQKPEAQVHPEFAASQKEHLELDSALKAADAPSIVKIPARWRN